MYTQEELAAIVKRCYENADFHEMYPLMEEDYEHISFWVTQVRAGKECAIQYYDEKAKYMRMDPSNHIEARLVKILEAPDQVRPGGLIENGIRIPEDEAFLHRKDVGKTAARMVQYTDREIIHTLAIPTVSENGLLKQVLIANPYFYKWEEL